jgi:hypothetical protein
MASMMALDRTFTARCQNKRVEQRQKAGHIRLFAMKDHPVGQVSPATRSRSSASKWTAADQDQAGLWMDTGHAGESVDQIAVPLDRHHAGCTAEQVMFRRQGMGMSVCKALGTGAGQEVLAVHAIGQAMGLLWINAFLFHQPRQYGLRRGDEKIEAMIEQHEQQAEHQPFLKTGIATITDAQRAGGQQGTQYIGFFMLRLDHVIIAMPDPGTQFTPDFPGRKAVNGADRTIFEAKITARDRDWL